MLLLSYAPLFFLNFNWSGIIVTDFAFIFIALESLADYHHGYFISFQINGK